MRPTLRSSVASALVVALVATACSGDDDSATTTSTSGPADTAGDAPANGDVATDLDGEGLTIGFIRAPIGLFGVLGSAQAGGLALAVEDVAAGGGVLGGPLTIAGDQPDTDRDVVTVLDDLVSDGANLIVGPSSSEEALAIIPQLAASDAIVCGASTTAPGIAETPEAAGRFLRTTFDDNIVAVNAFDRIRQQTATILDRAAKVTIAARDDAYGDSVSGALAPLLGLVGVEATVLQYEAENQVLDEFAAEVAATEPDVAVIISLAEGPRLSRLIVDAGVAPDRVLGLDGLTSPRFAGKANMDDPADYEDITVIGATGPLDFLTRLLDEPSADGEVLYSAQAYDCAIAFALAVEASGSTDPDEVSTALREVTGGGEVCTSYGECAEQLRRGGDINYDGPSGPIDFTESGEPGGGRILTARLTDGLLRVVADLRITLDEIRARVAPRVAGFIGDIQVALADLGYYTGAIDGEMNDGFVAAITAFQTDNGLEPTGQLDTATIAAIQDALAERGLLLETSIRDVQRVLTELGYYTGPIDGRWSDELSQAIAAFQTDLGIEPTGILDAATLRAIYAAGVQAGEGAATTTTEPTTTTTTSTTTTAPATTTSTTTTAPATTTTSSTSTSSPTTTTTVPEGAGSVMGVLNANDDLSELRDLIQLPGMEPVLAALSEPNVSMTLFAPTNDAIPDDAANLPAEELSRIIQAHLVAQVLTAPLAPGTHETLLSGATITVDGAAPDTTLTNFDASVTANVVGDPIQADGNDTASPVVWPIDAILTPPPAP